MIRFWVRIGVETRVRIRVKIRVRVRVIGIWIMHIRMYIGSAVYDHGYVYGSTCCECIYTLSDSCAYIMCMHV